MKEGGHLVLGVVIDEIEIKIEVPKIANQAVTIAIEDATPDPNHDQGHPIHHDPEGRNEGTTSPSPGVEVLIPIPLRSGT